MHGRTLERVADPQLLARAAASRVAHLLSEATSLRGRCSIVLAGGGTPMALYAALAAMPAGTIPWERVSIFFGDERCVAPDETTSNYRLAHETLLRHVAVPAEQVHRIRGEIEPALAADGYEAVLRSAFPDMPAPAFDIVLLGVGADGHTASLFPGSSSLDERARWVVATTAPPSAPVQARVTLTVPALCGATTVIFLAMGPGKRDVVSAVFGRGPGSELLPAAHVLGRGETVWMVDAEAAPSSGPRL